MILVDEWPRFGEELLIRFTLCSFCIMSMRKNLSLTEGDVGHRRLSGGH